MPRQGLGQHNLTTFAVLGASHDEWAMRHGPDVGSPFLFRNFADRRFAEPADVPVFFQPPTSGPGPTTPFLPVFNWDQAAVQLTRIDLSWSAAPGAPATVTYGFRSTAVGMPEGFTGFSLFSAAQIAATEAALQLWSDVANITFVRVSPGGYTNSATMLFANYFEDPPVGSAFGFYPGSTAASASAGDVWINMAVEANADLTLGTFGPQVLAHEIGHAIGIAHPADYDASDEGDPTYEVDAVYWQDSRAFTVMSYFGSPPVGFALGAFAAGPQLHDIAAAQLLYGANMTTRTGDTVYGFNSNTGRAHYTITADEQAPVFAIWDAGGIDTLDLSVYSTAVEIDLREEAFSSAGPGSNGLGVARGNIAIARGAVIENGIGGSGADLIVGNAAVNHLTGNVGADTFDGGGLSDLLHGGAGRDVAIYSIASTSASWSRNADGTWTVTAGADGIDLLSSVEVLRFTDLDVWIGTATRSFSGDTTSDILFRRADGLVASWEVTGTSIDSASLLPTAGPEWSVLGTGDISGDGRDDVLWQRDDGLVYSWTMNGGAVNAAAVLATLGGEWTFLGVGDFNGDLTDDLAWRRTDGLVFAWTMNASAIESGSVVTSLNSVWQIAGFGDFNGDGRDDFLWRRADNGQSVIWHMNGSAIESSGFTSVQAGLDWFVVGIGDTNGDGRDDIIVQRASDGMIALWAMDGTSVLSATNVAAANPAHWTVRGIGDYNGDGREDILWQNDNGLVYVWLMNGANIIGSGGFASVGPEWSII